MKSMCFVCGLSIALAVMFGTSSASGANVFLKVAGIDGGSTNARHVGWSDIQSFNIGVQNEGWLPPGGATRASFSPMHIQKLVDKASPKFFGGVAVGTHYPTATIDVVKTPTDSQPFVRWEFEDVIISSYSTGWSSDVPVEAISLDYRRIEYTFWPQNPDGSIGNPIVFGWDRQTGSQFGSGGGSLADFEFVTNFAATSVPEPGTLTLLCGGLAVVAVWRRTKRRAARRANERHERRVFV